MLLREKGRQPALLELKTKVIHELVRGKTKNFPSAAAHLARASRAQLINGTHPWVTEGEFFLRFVDIADVKGLIPPFTTMVAPSSQD